MGSPEFWKRVCHATVTICLDLKIPEWILIAQIDRLINRCGKVEPITTSLWCMDEVNTATLCSSAEKCEDLRVSVKQHLSCKDYLCRPCSSDDLLIFLTHSQPPPPLHHFRTTGSNPECRRSIGVQQSYIQHHHYNYKLPLERYINNQQCAI